MHWLALSQSLYQDTHRLYTPLQIVPQVRNNVLRFHASQLSSLAFPLQDMRERYRTRNLYLFVQRAGEHVMNTCEAIRKRPQCWFLAVVANEGIDGVGVRFGGFDVGRVFMRDRGLIFPWSQG